MMLDAEGVENEDGEEAGDMPAPPAGLPRSALRVLLLLREMGVGSYEPGVALQLLEVCDAVRVRARVRVRVRARARDRVRVKVRVRVRVREPGVSLQLLEV